MTKRILKIILLAVMMFFVTMPLFAQAETYSHLYYTVNDNNTITITGYDESTTHVVIPSEIDGKKVTSIGNNAFDSCYDLTAITIPDSITFVAMDAFSYCINLKNLYISDISAYLNIEFENLYASPMCYADKLYINGSHAVDITIPDDITRIPKYAFYDCDYLTKITIPNSVTFIDEEAFLDCSGLTSIIIPDSVTSIDDKAFYNCDNLIDITIGNGVTSIGRNVFYNTAFFNDSENWDEGVLYIGNYLIDSNSELAAEYTIKNETITIADYAFEYYDSLTSITIPDSITYIGANAFYKCSNLENVYISDIVAYLNINFTNLSSNPMCYAKNLYLNNEFITNLVIPEGATQIPMYAFRDCDSLTSITIPDSVISIDYRAFWDCNGLTSITIPDSITSIGDYAFYGCSNLKSVTLGSGITCIKESIFMKCSNLKNIIIPKCTTEIETNAFDGCENLTDIAYGGSEEEWAEMYIAIGNDYLKNATIYYNTSIIPIPITTATVTKTETEDTWSFDVELEKIYDDSYVYAVMYDSNDQIIGINKVVLNTAGSTTVDVSKTGNASYAKVFIWTNALQPIIKPETIEL